MKLVSRDLKGRQGEQGFTLVEILVAMGLLMIGMTSIAALFAVGLDELKKAQVRAESGEAALVLMDELRGQLVDQVHIDMNDRFLESFHDMSESVERLAQDEERALPGVRDLRYTYEATRVPGRSMQYLAEIHLHWKSGGRPERRSLRAVFDLSPSLAKQRMQNTLEYRVPSTATLEGEYR